MDLIEVGQFSLTGLSKINILLGKNGCGKSTLLKKIDEKLVPKRLGEISYVTPERGGMLNFDYGVEQNSANDQTYARNSKRHNQWNQFKNYSVTQYRRLLIIYLTEIEKDRTLPGFDTILDKINSLLANIKIARTNKGDFDLVLKSNNQKIDSTSLSSGESELIALAIECLTFEKSCEKEKQNILLMDEPDVHLHPDLQSNFIAFLITLVQSGKFSIIIATHSTAILGALLNFSESRFAVMGNGDNSITFRPLNEMYQNILPVFGAHPLSNIFNQNPILLVEGEDDVRIWQEAIRSANRSIKFYPCSVGGLGNMNDYENAVIEILNGVYDNAKAYSLRDRDDGDEQTINNPPLIRFKLSCRAAENLILCDEVLGSLNMNWVQLEIEIEKWLQSFTTHSKFAVMTAFKNSGYDRKGFDLKELRNILIGLTETSRPWEVVVGKAIAHFVNGLTQLDFNNNKLCNYLGTKLSEHLREI